MILRRRPEGQRSRGERPLHRRAVARGDQEPRRPEATARRRRAAPPGAAPRPPPEAAAAGGSPVRKSEARIRFPGEAEESRRFYASAPGLQDDRRGAELRRGVAIRSSPGRADRAARGADEGAGGGGGPGGGDFDGVPAFAATRRAEAAAGERRGRSDPRAATAAAAGGAADRSL
jgi:hypothetical protein